MIDLDENEKHFKEKIDNISTYTEDIVRVLERLSLGLIGHCKSSQKKIKDKFDIQQNEGEKCISQFERCLEEFTIERKTVDLMKLLQFKKEIKSIHCPKESCEISNTNRLDRSIHYTQSVDAKFDFTNVVCSRTLPNRYSPGNPKVSFSLCFSLTDYPSFSDSICPQKIAQKNNDKWPVISDNFCQLSRFF